MKKEVLIKYFEKDCSAAEAAEVELWLLDPQNKESFEHFLECYWDEHASGYPQLVETERSEEKRHGVLRRFLLRGAVAAAVLTGVVLAVQHFVGTNTGKESVNTIAAVIAEPKQISPVVNADTIRGVEKKVNSSKKLDKSKAKPKIRTIHKEPVMAKVSLEFPDSVTLPIGEPKTQRMTQLNKVMINYEAISKLDKAQQFEVLQGLALNVSFHKATFQDIVAIFRDKYGVELELCSRNTSVERSQEFTTRFANVTFPNLIEEMSKEMMFSYTVAKNVIKICFN